MGQTEAAQVADPGAVSGGQVAPDPLRSRLRGLGYRWLRLALLTISPREMAIHSFGV